MKLFSAVLSLSCLLFLARLSLLQLFTLALTLAVHEAGHVVCGLWMGYPPKSLRLSPTGLTLDFCCPLLPYKKEAMLHLAGPAANLFCLIPTLLLLRYRMNEAHLFLFFCHALAALTNLLPLKGLDGGRALYALLCLATSAERAARLLSTVGLLTLLAVSLLSLYVLFTLQNPSLCAMCLVLFFEEKGAAEKKKRETKYPRLS